MKQAVKHAANYQCSESFSYLQVLISVSDKFKNKEEMGAALNKIQPKTITEEQQTNGTGEVLPQ